MKPEFIKLVQLCNFNFCGSGFLSLPFETWPSLKEMTQKHNYLPQNIFRHFVEHL
jgi:hypothetical protein